MVNTTKEWLQRLRDDERDPLLKDVDLFCNGRGMDIPNMDYVYFCGKSKLQGNVESFTTQNHYCIELFYSVAYVHFQEFNIHFK